MLAAGINSFFSLDGSACGLLLLVLDSRIGRVLYIKASSQGIFAARLPLESVTLTVLVTSCPRRVPTDEVQRHECLHSNGRQTLA